MGRTKGAKNKPKTDKKAPKADKKGKDESSAPKIYNNDDPEAKALFLNHLPKIEALRDAINKATANLRNAYKTAKAQGGFEKVDFDYAIAVKTAEAEAKTRAKIARQLTIARFMGSDLGGQLDLFLEPDRTPAADRAYHEGETASMKNEPAQPSYAPETEQYRQYMKGFHDHQAKIAGKGIKPLHPEVERDAKETAAQKKKNEKQKAEDAKAFAATDPASAPLTSGTAMTRSEFLAQQAANGAGGAPPAEAEDEGSHFQKN
jgi:hypothetical protein